METVLLVFGNNIIRRAHHLEKIIDPRRVIVDRFKGFNMRHALFNLPSRSVSAVLPEF